MANQNTEQKQKNIKSKRKLAFIIGGFSLLGLVCLVAIFFALYNYYYADKVLPNVKIGTYAIGGKNKTDLDKILADAATQELAQNITYTYKEKTWTKTPTDLGIKFDLSKTANQALSIGHQENFWQTVKDQVGCLFNSCQAEMVIAEEPDDLRNLIAKVASEIDQPEKDASLELDNGQVVISKEATGNRLNQDSIHTQTIKNITSFGKTDILLSLELKNPIVKETAIADTQKQAAGYISDQFNFTYLKRNFYAAPETVWLWLKFTKSNKSLTVDFDQDAMKTWITAKIAAKIDDPLKEARLKYDNGNVSVFQQAQDGQVIDQDKLVSDIISALKDGKHSAEITTKTSKAKDVDLSNLNNLYLKDLVGTATTSFGNSPANRIHNITVGANTLNGMLIRPSEEVSVVNSLGEIDASTGYLPELVIKENTTVPDYGGGLCQVSSTLFRAAMNAGLDITARTNHSYRVSYYEPPVGMDATVYDPSPDLKFINTYNDYILIESKINGNTITFNFYGKSDSRTVKLTDPIVTDITPPEPPLYTNTDSLCQGVVQKVDTAHNGAKAIFDYYVYDAAGKETKHQTFKSSYVPWQAKYLVGTKTDGDCGAPPPS